MKDQEILEINEILKKQGMNRAERRYWIKTYRKEARLQSK